MNSKNILRLLPWQLLKEWCYHRLSRKGAKMRVSWWRNKWDKRWEASPTRCIELNTWWIRSQENSISISVIWQWCLRRISNILWEKLEWVQQNNRGARSFVRLRQLLKSLKKCVYQMYISRGACGSFRLKQKSTIKVGQIYRSYFEERHQRGWIHLFEARGWWRGWPLQTDCCWLQNYQRWR